RRDIRTSRRRGSRLVRSRRARSHPDRCARGQERGALGSAPRTDEEEGMSEYQYYEFLALDRPLTREQMSELRACSTRARITTTGFVNEYHFGSFKGNADAWMERYFDGFLYTANW